MSSTDWTGDRLRDLADFWSQKLVLESAALGIYERLEPDGSTARALAAALGLDPRAARLMLDALAGIGLLQKGDGRYRNSRIARRHLVPASPDYLGHALIAANRTWELWSRLRQALQTGLRQRENFIFADEPEAARSLLQAIHDRAEPHVGAMLDTGMIDPREYRTMLDLGGGAGTYSIAFCRANRHLRVRLVDLGPGIELARERVEAARLTDQIDLLELDFESRDVPGTYDLIWISNIIHGRGPARNRELLQRLQRHLEPGGEIAIHDIVMSPDRTRPARGAVFSLHMLLNNGEGRCYAFEEIREWLDEAGLGHVRLTDEHDDHRIVFATARPNRASRSG